MVAAAGSSPDLIPQSLIGADDPPPFSVINPAGRADLLLVCDHASRAFPAASNRLGLSEPASMLHIAWDIGAAELTRRLSERFNAPAVLAGYSRLLIDCNRALADPTSIVSVSDGETIPGNLRLDERQRELRARSFFEPYHGAISRQLAESRRQGAEPAFISVHSFTPRFGAESRPWHVGVLWDRDARIAGPLLQALRAQADLCVGDNLPYSGRHPADYTVARHAEGSGLPHVCLEVRQDLLGTPAGVADWERILGDALQPILAQGFMPRL